MRSPAEVCPRCVQRIANEIASDAAGDSQLAVLDCTYDVMKRECPQEAHSRSPDVMSEMLVGERLARAQRAGLGTPIDSENRNPKWGWVYGEGGERTCAGLV